MTPAAGPDSAVRTGSRRAVAVDITPPLDCTMWNWPANLALRARRRACPDRRPTTGCRYAFERRRGGPLELADFGQDLGRGRDVGVGPDGPRGGRRGTLVGRVGVGVDEDDGDRLRAPRRQRPRSHARTSAGSTASRIVPSASVRSSTSIRMSRSATGMNRPTGPRCGPIAAAHLQHVAKAARRDDADARALRSSRALVPTVVPWTMEPSAETGPRDRRPSRKPTASSPRLDGTLAVGKRRSASPSRFGGPRATKTMIHATWHMTTVAFLTVGFALLLARLGPRRRRRPGDRRAGRRRGHRLRGARGGDGAIPSIALPPPCPRPAHRHRGAGVVGRSLNGGGAYSGAGLRLGATRGGSSGCFG